VGQPGEAGKIEGLNKQRKNKKPLLSQYKLSKLSILPLKLEFSSPARRINEVKTSNRALQLGV